MSGDYKQLAVINERTRFYDGQYLVDQDFIDEQKYHIDRQRGHARTLHVSGVVAGLDVTPAKGARTVEVSPGTALDRDGRQIVLAAPWTSQEIDGEDYLYIAYRPNPTQMQESDQGVRGETRLEEAAIIFTNPRLLGEDDPYDLPPDSAWDKAIWQQYEQGQLPPPVMLARLYFDAGNLQVDSSLRRYSGLRLPGGKPGAAALRADDVGAVALSTMGDGDLVPRLTVTWDGNVGIGTTDPKAKLDVSGSLNVSGAATFGDTLSVTGDANFRSKIVANVADGGALEFLGWSEGWNIQLAKGSKKTLYLNRDSGEDANIVIGPTGAEVSMIGKTGNVGIGTVTPAAKFDVSGSLNVTGAATLGSTLKVAGATTLAGLNSDATTVGSLNVTGVATVGSLNVTGVATVGSLNVTGAATLGSLTVGGAVRSSSLIIGNMTVTAFTNDGGLPGNSGQSVPTEQAVRAFVTGQVGTLRDSVANKHPSGGSMNNAFTAPNVLVATGANTFEIDGADGSPNAGYLRFGDQSGWKFHFTRRKESWNNPSNNTGTTGALVTITDAGRLGIGTISPEMLLHLKADASIAGVKLSPTPGDDFYALRWKNIPPSVGFDAGMRGPYLSGPSAGFLGLNSQFDANDYVLAWGAQVSGRYVAMKGNFIVSNGTKNFAISHPLRPDHTLVHACVEGPEAAVYYRGVARLRGGRATVRLPDYFELLTPAEDRTVLLTPVGEQPYLLSYTPIVDGVFAVYGDRADGVFAWQVMAVRADVPELEVEVENTV